MYNLKEISIIKHDLISVNGQLSGSDLKLQLNALGWVPEDFLLIFNGKLVGDDAIISNAPVHIIPRVLGGKGGFGSMLRAIGAQIEKTTNREACRDLSGRRLRDINEEQRLKNWINQQAEREKEAKQRRKKKLEKLCEKPKHEFKDEQYDQERSVLPEMVEDAVLQGLQATCSTKRKTSHENVAPKKKKPKLWLDEESDEDLSSDQDEDQSGLDGVPQHENGSERGVTISESMEATKETLVAQENKEDNMASATEKICVVGK